MKRSWQIAKDILLIFATVVAVVASILIPTFQIGFTPVLSNSMAPTIDSGEIVVTRPELKTRLKIGDVVVLPLPDKSGQRFLHRIIDIQKNDEQIFVRTKGDFNAQPDPWTLRIDSTKVPVAKASIPKLALQTNQLRSPSIHLALSALVIILAAVGVVRALGEIRQNSKRQA